MLRAHLPLIQSTSSLLLRWPPGCWLWLYHVVRSVYIITAAAGGMQWSVDLDRPAAC